MKRAKFPLLSYLLTYLHTYPNHRVSCKLTKNTYYENKFRYMLKSYFLDKLPENVLCNNPFLRVPFNCTEPKLIVVI